MMQSCLDVLGDRRCCIAREMTKVHEEFLRGTISELIPVLDELKGEMVVVMDGNHDDYSKDIDMSHIMRMVQDSMEAGMTRSEAVKDVAVRTGIPRNRIYELVHRKEPWKGPC